MMRRLLALLAVWLLTACGTPSFAGPHMHGQATSNACAGQPLGVVGLALCDIANLKATNGARSATTNVSAYSRPAGFSWSASTLNTDVTADTTINLIDNASEGGFYYSGTHTSTLTDFSLTSNSAISGGGFPLAVGETSGGTISGSPNFDGEHGTIDGTGMKSAQTTMVQTWGGGTFKLAYTNLLHPARDHFASGPGATTLIFDHDYFDAYCQNTTGTDHCEDMHFQAGGTVTITSNYINAADGITVGGSSGSIQAQTGNGTDPSTYTSGPLTLNVVGNIFNYGCVINQATFSLKAVFDDITINVQNNTWCVAATAGTTGTVKQADIKVTSVVGTWTAVGTANVNSSGGGTAPEQGGLTGGNNIHLTTWGSGAQFAPGDTLTDQTSGATAVVSSVVYHNVTVNNLGGNLNLVTGGAVNP